MEENVYLPMDQYDSNHQRQFDFSSPPTRHHSDSFDRPQPVPRNKLNYTKWLLPSDRGPRPPMNQQWGGNTHPSNRQPAIPPREEENTYLPIDQPTSIGERGRGMMPPNTRPPVQPPFPNRYPVNPRSPHDRPNFDRPQHERFPFDRPPMDRPPMDRPPTDRPAMPVPPPFIQPEEPDTYEPVNAPTRPPPAIPQLPPTNFGTRSPGSSFNSNRSIGFSPPVSFKESGMSQNHSPYRNGSRDSTSSGEHSDPPQPSPGIPKTQVPKHHGFQLPKNDQTSKHLPPFRARTSVDHSASGPVKSPVFPPKPAASSKPTSPFRQQQNTLSQSLTNALKLTSKPNAPPNIENQRWFQNVGRHQATSSINREKREGCFIVRPGRDPNRPYSLTVYANQKIYNLQICKRSDSSYAFGSEKPKEASFSNPVDLVNHFMDSSLVLAEGEGEVTLTGPP